MACSGSRESDLLYIKQYYTSAFSWHNSALNYLDDALDHWELNEDHEAIYDLHHGAAHLWWAIDYLTYKYSPFYPEMPIPHFLEHHTTEEAAVDMDSILSAMITANFEQLQKFIGLVDAYRSALWDKPFNAEFYAGLARGFRE